MIHSALNVKFTARLKPVHYFSIGPVKPKLREVVLVWSQLLVLEAGNHWPESEQQRCPNTDSQYTDEKREADLMAQQPNGHTYREESWTGAQTEKMDVD